MDAGMEVKEYRSPQYKLVQFFERSRNQWKRKCQDRGVRSGCQSLNEDAVRSRSLAGASPGGGGRVGPRAGRAAAIKTQRLSPNSRRMRSRQRWKERRQRADFPQ
jgi:hypothetical protein